MLILNERSFASPTVQLKGLKPDDTLHPTACDGVLTWHHRGREISADTPLKDPQAKSSPSVRIPKLFPPYINAHPEVCARYYVRAVTLVPATKILHNLHQLSNPLTMCISSGYCWRASNPGRQLASCKAYLPGVSRADAFRQQDVDGISNMFVEDGDTASSWQFRFVSR
jgi:hypothetical protein